MLYMFCAADVAITKILKFTEYNCVLNESYIDALISYFPCEVPPLISKRKMMCGVIHIMIMFDLVKICNSSYTLWKILLTFSAKQGH